MCTNGRRVRAKFLEPEDCALDQALYVCKKRYVKEIVAAFVVESADNWVNWL